MKKKFLGVFVCMLLLATSFSVAGINVYQNYEEITDYNGNEKPWEIFFLNFYLDIISLSIKFLNPVFHDPGTVPSHFLGRGAHTAPARFFQRSNPMRILFINNDGGGFADYVDASEGMTVQEFFAQRMAGRKAEDFLIRVNRQPVARDCVLRESDRVTITPTKIEGAATR